MRPQTEDVQFWLETVREVTRQSAGHIISGRAPRRLVVREKPYYAVRQEFSTYSKALEEMVYGGVDKNTLRRFKREEFAVEAVLDLHGMTENEAYASVDNFIPQSYALGRRCVIIVTGKGLNLHNNDDDFAAHGVLKKLVPMWLNQPRLRGMILVYKHPSARLGGNGALYILLRRNRENLALR